MQLQHVCHSTLPWLIFFSLGLMRPLIILFAAGLFFSVTATARTSETTITGVVVDSHGRPVSQALVSAGLRGRQFTVSGAERIVIMTDIQAGRDGRFEFTTTE